MTSVDELEGDKLAPLRATFVNDLGWLPKAFRKEAHGFPVSLSRIVLPLLQCSIAHRSPNARARGLQPEMAGREIRSATGQSFLFTGAGLFFRIRL